jgi:phosphopantetheinyl transferase (holo-ACP synthase)
VTVLSTWCCEPGGGPVIGCGVDAERVERFRAQTEPGSPSPWPLLFTDREVAHALALPDPALGLCAAFCVKEAVVKALGVPIDYRDCELLFSPPGGVQGIYLNPEFIEEHGISRGVARIMYRGEARECVAAVTIHGRRESNERAEARVTR